MVYVIDLSLATSEQIEKSLGDRIEQIRLSRNITQQMLADEAGISLRTIGRLEKGEGTSLDTFIRVLIAFGIQDNLKNILPDPNARPLERVNNLGSERKRARPTKPDESDIPWSWGD
ncbi:MAG: helix-turn-helix transcriptional regulator [Thermoplasmata archaeon]|nr:helix-turn-helix transcriptional regulator [Thermoplasmata archaeon]